MSCQIEREISIYADEPEQLSASDLLDVLLNGSEVYLNNESYSFAEITDLLANEEIKIAAEESLTSDSSAINKLYIKKIAEMMG